MIDVDQNYTCEKECEYKNEKYKVRDNGAILRMTREGKPKRPKDEIWTFGDKIVHGYAQFCGIRVHRIVATAFCGKPPTDQHVVDHIDTNRQNNRPENLRWLTKLDNILLNPLTKAKIEYLCGSVENFLKDPSQLNGHENEDKSFSWMRAVTHEEAQNTLINWQNFLSKPRVEDKSPRNPIEEWIFKQNHSYKKTLDFLSNIKPVKINEKPNDTPVAEPIHPQTPAKVTEKKPSSTLVKKKQKKKIEHLTKVKIVAIDVLFEQVECYFCHKPHFIPFVRYLVDENGLKHDYAEIDDKNIPDLQFGDEFLEVVKKYILEHPEKGYVMGEVKKRYSKTMDEEYMSYGCPECDGIVGDFYLNDLEMNIIYETDESLMNRIQLKFPFEALVKG